jgi:hypothetical protein
VDVGAERRAPTPGVLGLDRFVAGTHVAPWEASLCAYLLLQLAGGGAVGANSSSASASYSDQGQGERAGGGSQPCHARAVAVLPSVEAEAAVLLARAVGGPAQGGGMPPVAVAALHVVLRTHTWFQMVPMLQEGNPGSGGGPLPRFPIVEVALDLGALPSVPSLDIKVDGNRWRWGDLLPWPSVACRSALWRLRLSAALLPGGQLGALTRLEIGDMQRRSVPPLLDGALVVEISTLVSEPRQGMQEGVHEGGLAGVSGSEDAAGQWLGSAGGDEGWVLSGWSGMRWAAWGVTLRGVVGSNGLLGRCGVVKVAHSSFCGGYSSYRACHSPARYPGPHITHTLCARTIRRRRGCAS